jgi:hypothetical protein
MVKYECLRNFAKSELDKFLFSIQNSSSVPSRYFTLIHKDSFFFFLQILIAGREVNSQQLSCFDVHFLSLMTAGKA